VFVQTRRHDEVFDALISGDVTDIVREDEATARLLALPPFGGLARVSGEAASDFVSHLEGAALTVRSTPGGYVVRAADTDSLTRALSEVVRPPGRLRLEVW
jgi:hypothetical protein